jgi:hypothetical protein
MRWTVWTLLGLAACSEYKFHGEDDPPEGTEDTAETNEDKPWDSGGDDSGEDPSDPEDPDPDSGYLECPEPDTSRGTMVVDESCLIEVTPGTFTPVIEWSSTLPGASYASPVVGPLTDDDGDGDVDGDDMPDVVIVGTGGLVTALSGDGSGVIWSYNISSFEPSTAAIGDIDADGFPEVVVSSGAGFYAFRGATGAVMWTNTSSGLGGTGICGGVSVYDLDGDGAVEVVQGSIILRGADGSLRGSGAYGRGTGYPGGTYAGFGVAADIDQDGDLEVVVGNALYDADGNTIWYNGQSDGFVAVANFDADPYGEIVVAYSGNVRLQDDDGTVLWSGNYTGSRIGPPTVADFDGDGEPEIGVAGNGVYVMIETDGALSWSNTVNDYSSGFTGSAVFDFEGDGAAEVVYADENDVWVYDGTTGAVKMQETRHSSTTCSEYPIIADVDLDGHAEIIYASAAYSGPENGVTVIGDADDSWMPARPVWNQHTYSITNVLDDGGIPPVPATNWLTYNNFRSGDLAAASGGAMSDAIPELVDVCTVECDDGLLRVVFRVGNGGVEPLPPGVVASLYARHDSGWVLLDTRATPAPVAPGETTPGWVFDLNPDHVPHGVLRFVVDDDDGTSWITECHEDNNLVLINDGLCP